MVRCSFLKHGQRPSKIQRYLELGKEGIQETVGERGKYLLVLSSRSKKQDFKPNGVGVFITNLAKIYHLISAQNLWYNLQLYHCFILLQGLNPVLSGYEAALALYEREVGPKPEKVCHLFFGAHVLNGMGKNHEKESGRILPVLYSLRHH